MDGGGYGGNRFYHQGEIYNYDPEAGSYRGSISGQMLAQPGQYQAPALATNPGSYDDYMADDPYYQMLQEQNAPVAEPDPEPELRVLSAFQRQFLSPQALKKYGYDWESQGNGSGGSSGSGGSGAGGQGSSGGGGSGHGGAGGSGGPGAY